MEILYIWIESTFACIHIIVLGIYRTSFQHNLQCFINACVHVVNDYSQYNLYHSFRGERVGAFAPPCLSLAPPLEVGLAMHV